VTYSCNHNSSRFSSPIFPHSWRFSAFRSLQSITPHIRGLIQNFPDWRCKNHKIHHKAYWPPSPPKHFPPACTHRSHRLLHFWNASWKFFSVSVKHFLRFGPDLLNGIEPASFQLQFHFWKSQGAKSGKYSGWGTTAILFFARNWWVRTEVWDGALPWWSSQVCSRQSWGRCLRTFSRSLRKT